MLKTAFAVYRQIQIAMRWYGADYTFYREVINDYGEPIKGEGTPVQTLTGVYHSSERSFIELLNSEGTSVKSKVSRGIICDTLEEPEIQQGDLVVIQEKDFYVTAIEPVLYSDQVVAYEISVDELVKGSGI